ncbi:hypothetical protein EGR_11285 [Echinococcus granulosus]|uniref:Uncharacterized protein n=1 Tax=Echinococcus granulosus TaxID=6210 RepID=W6UK31_ECHGR|nr:hypothetical protein EGR_11285 [Echinococcus granulosus]EUB53864.1 hypothetical protein EGR_11285 [Echinococcus granulosus]
MKTALTFVTLSLVLFIAWCSAKPKLLSDKMHHMDVHMSSGRHEKVVYEADEQKDVEGKDVDITGGKRGQLPSILHTINSLPRRLNPHHVQWPVSSAPHYDDSTRSTEK